MSAPPRGPHALDPTPRLEALDETRPLRPFDDDSDATEHVLLHHLIERIRRDPRQGEGVARGGWSDFADPRWADEIHEYYCSLQERNRKQSGDSRPRVR